MEEFDLTPGGDEYKEELANRHETVYRLQLFASPVKARLHDVRARIRSHLKSIALALGMSRERVERFQRVVSLARRQSPLAVAVAVGRAIRRWIWSKDASLLYRLDRGKDGGSQLLAPEVGLPIHRDTLGDFLRYSGSDRWMSRQRLMAEAILRMDKGEHCYTIVEDGVLVHYGWLQLNPPHIDISEVGMRFSPDPDTAVLYDFYTEPRARGRGLYKRTLRHILQEAFQLGAKSIVIGAMDRNLASRRAIESTGFRLAWRLIRRRVLGWCWRWEELV